MSLILYAVVFVMGYGLHNIMYSHIVEPVEDFVLCVKKAMDECKEVE